MLARGLNSKRGKCVARPLKKTTPFVDLARGSLSIAKSLCIDEFKKKNWMGSTP